MTDKESPDNQSGNEQNLDWDSQRLINHPKGMEQAMAENISKMEEQTRAIIESGSIEEIERPWRETSRNWPPFKNTWKSSLTVTYPRFSLRYIRHFSANRPEAKF